MTIQQAEKKWLRKIADGLMDNPACWFGDYYAQPERTQEIMEQARERLYDEFVKRSNKALQQSKTAVCN